MHYPDSRWRPRCQGKSRDDVSGRILNIVSNGVANSVIRVNLSQGHTLHY